MDFKSWADEEEENAWTVLGDDQQDGFVNDRIELNLNTDEDESIDEEDTDDGPYDTPWMPNGRVYPRDRREQFHAEAMDVYNYLRPTADDKNLRYLLFGRLREALHKTFGHPRHRSSNSARWADATIFGSFVNDLYLPDGDLDVVVVTNVPGADLSTLKLIRSMLYRHGFASRSGNARHRAQLIPARIPIIKFTDVKTMIQVDISINMTSGQESCAIIKRFAQHRIWGEYLSILVILLKHILAQHGLHLPFHGGLGSYSLALMVTHFLQTRDAAIYSKNSNTGRLLLGFLEYFSFTFDYDRHIIDVTQDGAEGGVQRKPCSALNEALRLTISDPQNPTRDAASSTFEIQSVIFLFKSLYRKLTQVLDSQGGRPLLSNIMDFPDSMNAVRLNLSNSKNQPLTIPARKHIHLGQLPFGCDDDTAANVASSGKFNFQSIVKKTKSKLFARIDRR